MVQLMYHHDARPYDVAAGEAAGKFRERLERQVEAGRATVGGVLEKIQRDIPEDRIAPAPALRFGIEPVTLDTAERPRARLALAWNGAAPLPIHDHALQQACERAEIPWAYARRLLEKTNGSAWGAELLAHNLGTIVPKTGRRFLLRSVAGELRGFLSDKFRRLDSRPIVDAFATACAKAGAVPIEGRALETRVQIKAILPRLFEPIPGQPNEVVAFGIALENSDFGDGALSLRAFLRRVWCTNDAVQEEALRQVHLGGRLADDVAWSERTYRLDTNRSASAIADLVQLLTGEPKTTAVCGAIAKAAEAGVSPSGIAAFLKKHLNEGESQQVTDAFTSADVENLPPGQNRWRLSNAVSWIAGQTADQRRRIELEKVAAQALNN